MWSNKKHMTLSYVIFMKDKNTVNTEISNRMRSAWSLNIMNISGEYVYVPVAQRQRCVVALVRIHEPPFPHGLGEHGKYLDSQRLPVYSGGHEHLTDNNNFMMSATNIT